MRTLLTRAVKMSLKDDEQKILIRALKIDPELVFHIGMTAQRLPNIVINNPNIAFELLVCMTHTT